MIHPLTNWLKRRAAKVLSRAAHQRDRRLIRKTTNAMRAHLKLEGRV